mgnify:CR=1 FL=1
MVESRAHRRQSVEVLRGDERVPVTRGMIPAHLVGIDDDDAWAHAGSIQVGQKSRPGGMHSGAHSTVARPNRHPAPRFKCARAAPSAACTSVAIALPESSKSVTESITYSEFRPIISNFSSDLWRLGIWGACRSAFGPVSTRASPLPDIVPSSPAASRTSASGPSQSK